MQLSDYAALIAAGSPFVLQALNLAKFVRARDVNGIVTLVSSLVVGMAITFALAASDFADGLSIDHLNAVTLALLGIVVGSSASTGWDFLAAHDATQSAAKPQLVPPSSAISQTEIATSSPSV